MPSEDDYSVEIDWIYRCLGLGDERDEVGKLIFAEIIKANKQGSGVTSRDLMEKCQVTQPAVVYHLNLVMRSGLILKEGRVYYLRGRTLQRTLEEMEYDIVRRFQLLRKIATKIDESW